MAFIGVVSIGLSTLIQNGMHRWFQPWVSGVDVALGTAVHSKSAAYAVRDSPASKHQYQQSDDHASGPIVADPC